MFDCTFVEEVVLLTEFVQDWEYDTGKCYQNKNAPQFTGLTNIEESMGKMDSTDWAGKATFVSLLFLWYNLPWNMPGKNNNNEN